MKREYFPAIKHTILSTYSNYGIMDHTAIFVLQRLHLTHYLLQQPILLPRPIGDQFTTKALRDYAAYQRTPVMSHAEVTRYLPRSMHSILRLLFFTEKLRYFYPTIPAYLYPSTTLRYIARTITRFLSICSRGEIISSR